MLLIEELMVLVMNVSCFRVLLYNRFLLYTIGLHSDFINLFAPHISHLRRCIDREESVVICVVDSVGGVRYS